jgi:hypothetical protein
MKKALALILMALSVVMAPLAHADEPVLYESGPYFIGQIGAYGAEETQQFNGYELSSDVSGHLAVGYKLNPMWSVQGDLGYFGTSGNNEYQFNAMPLTVAVRLSLPAGKFEPYMLGGGGAYFCKTKMNQGGETIDEVVMGGYLGLGALLHIGKMMVGGEFRYDFMDIYSRTAPNAGIEALFSVGYQY